jgi:hypothetical protein
MIEIVVCRRKEKRFSAKSSPVCGSPNINHQPSSFFFGKRGA